MPRTGTVFLEDYDLGLARTMGGELTEVEFDGEMVSVFAVRVDGVTGPDQYNGLIPIQMQDAEDAYANYVLPQIIVNRTGIRPAMNRWFPGGWEYQVPVSSEKVVSNGGVEGPAYVERKAWSYPFDIEYDVHIRARNRLTADRIYRKVGKAFWAYGQIYLVDSEGDERGYYAFQESTDQISELSEVASRVVGHMISLRVEAELDFNEPLIYPTQAVVIDSHQWSGAGIGPNGEVGVTGPDDPGSGSPEGTGGRQFVRATRRVNPYVKPD